MDRARLTFLALCTLEEACQQAKAGRVPASYGLRFALAYLYAVGDRRNEYFDREPYDDFWTAATQRDEHGACAHAFARTQVLTSSLNGIARAAGMERDPLLMARIDKAGEKV